MKAQLTRFGGVLCIWAIAVCGQSVPMRAELEGKSRRLGLALIVDQGEIGVYSFDGPPLFRRLPSVSARPAAVPSGKQVIWVIQGPPYTSSIEVEDTAGGVSESHDVPCWPQILAASPGAPPRIAFIANGTELRYGDANGTASHSIEGLGPFSNSAGWSPDARRLVFGRRGQILLLDTKTDLARQLASGEDPTWSPDGKWIAYRSADNQATLLEVGSAHTKLILTGHELAPLPLRWSPDSQYLAYVERRPAKAVQWQLAVLRLADGATTVVTPFNTIVGYVADWWWIVNYQSFCRGCAPH